MLKIAAYNVKGTETSRIEDEYRARRAAEARNPRNLVQASTNANRSLIGKLADWLNSDI